jgi:hypothetical protein
MADHAVGEREVWRVRHVRTIAVLNRRGAGHGANAVRLQVRRRINRLDPGDRCRRRGIDRAEFCRGVRTAQRNSV